VLFTFSNVNKIDLPVQFEQLNLMLGWLNPIGVNVDRAERQTSFCWHFCWCEARLPTEGENSVTVHIPELRTSTLVITLCLFSKQKCSII